MVLPPPYSVRRRLDAINREKVLLANMKEEKLRRLADMKKLQHLLSFIAVLAVSLWAIFSACFHFVLYIFGPSTRHQLQVRNHYFFFAVESIDLYSVDNIY